MIRGTLRTSLILTACTTALIGCGSSDGKDAPGPGAHESKRQSLLYAYPGNGQTEVPTRAPVVLRFTSDISLGDAEQSITLCCDDDGANLAFTAETVGPDPRGVLLTPAQPLSPLTQYTVDIRDLRLSNGTSADRTLRFTTRPLQEGPKSLVAKDDGFAIDRQVPNGGTNEPIMDFSTFRFQFTQPIDRASARYGDTVILTGGGETLEATLLVNGHYMTVDPKEKYLVPGQSYTLEITNGLASTFGESFGGTSIEFTPQDSSPRGNPAMLVQRITQEGHSRLTGKGINQVPVNGTLLGEDVNVTQASADAVVAELADVTQYPDVTPIRLPRGTKLTGSAIEMVMIGGAVPAGFGSGPVDMRLISDATGYLVPNPYNSLRADALRIVHLFMDVGIATEDPRANGGFTQDIMHIELVGVAQVDTTEGVLNLDAVGMVEPNILGQEFGYGLLSFQLQSYKDQLNPPTAPKDETGPTLQSWTLGTDTITGEDKSLLAKPGDPIILNFDEPIDPQSVEGNVTLYKTVNGGDEEEMPALVYVDGAAIVVKPEEDLQYSPEEGPVGYRLTVSTGVQDVVKNPLGSEFDEEFTLPTSVSQENLIAKMPEGITFRTDLIEYRQTNHAANIIAVYPGYPCALLQELLDDQGHGELDESRNLANNKAGICAGGYPGIMDGTESDNKPRNDSIPIMPLPGNRPIVIKFSKAVDPGTVRYGATFFVDKVDDLGNVLHQVPGKLETIGSTIQFIPSQPWDIGALYQYKLLSSGYEIQTSDQGRVRKMIESADFSCGQNSICDQAGTPIQTQPLGLLTIGKIDGGQTGFDRDYFNIAAGSSPKAGGPNFVQFFRGASISTDVLQIISTEPVADVNHNFMSEISNVGTSDIALISAGIYEFPIEEQGPDSIPSSSYPEYDPDGQTPSANSAKLLSRFRSQSLDDQLEPRIADTGIFGLSFGCNYGFDLLPKSCPKHKFTYLRSAIFAEVTSDITDEGIKIKMWPSMVLGTAIEQYALQKLTGGSQPAGYPGITGKQILRMRYGGNDRAQPVTGWISNSNNGPELNVNLDLYIDAPYAAELGIAAPANTLNLSSYEISLTMTGGIQFLDDGRMIIDQWNSEPEDITIKIHDSSSGRFIGYGDAFIPEYGTRLQLISSPIK